MDERRGTLVDGSSANSGPESFSQEQLVAVLENILEGVKTGDTLEGSIEFLLPYPPGGESEDADFMVRASYRIGNTEGQGGLRIIGGSS